MNETAPKCEQEALIAAGLLYDACEGAYADPVGGAAMIARMFMQEPELMYRIFDSYYKALGSASDSEPPLDEVYADIREQLEAL